MIKRTILGLSLALFVSACAPGEEAPSRETVESFGSVERLDPGIDAIVPADAVVERVVDGFEWVEGPLWVPDGYLLFAAIHDNSIRKWAPDEGVRLFLQPSGYQGSEPYGGPEPGSNGMTLDPSGRVVVAGHARRNVYRLESLEPGAPVTVLADRYQGKRLSSPNDLVYTSDGSLYFTDPPYGLPAQNDDDPLKELTANGVYRLRDAASIPAGAAPDESKLELVIGDLSRPNGLAFSPDQKILYVGVSGEDRVWMRYDVQPDGSVTNGRIFADPAGSEGVGGPDGIKVDEQGNVYGSGPGGLWILSPDGTHIGTVTLPERASNCAFGGQDGRTLFITASSSVYSIRLNVAGVRP